MKITSYLFATILFLFVIIETSYSQPGWEWINPVYGPYDLHNIEVADNQTMYIVGDKGSILKSTDRGVTWIRLSCLYFPEVNWKSASFLDKNRGAIAGQEGKIAETSNGGADWIGRVISMNNLNDIIVKEEFIICAGDSGSIYRKDASNSWIKQESNTLSNLYAIHFLDEQNGWCVGDSGAIIRTLDGGITWEDYSIDTLPDARLSDIEFINDTIGYITWLSNNKFKTVDGGETWFNDTSSLYFRNVNRFPITNSNSIFLTHEGQYFETGDNGLILKSEDHGISWVPSFESDINYHINDLKMLDNNTGIAVGSQGLITKTTDGGNFWENDMQEHTMSILGSAFFNTEEGYLVGSGSNFLYTNNGGDSFLEGYSNSSGFTDVAIHTNYPNGNGALAISDRYCYEFRQNSMIDYRVVSDYYLNKIESTGNQEVFIVGKAGTIVQIHNGDLSSPQIDNIGYDELFDISFYGNDRGYVVGDHGQFISGTRNAQGYWSWYDFPITATGIALNYTSFRGVHFFNQDVGIICGDDALILRTVDGGYTWSQIDFLNTPGFDFEYQPSPSLHEIQFVNDTLGYIFGEDGIILKTADAGLTWEMSFKGIFYGYDFHTAWMSNNGIGFLGGNDGMILRTNTAGLDLDIEPIHISVGELKPDFSNDHYQYIAIIPDTCTSAPRIFADTYINPVDIQINNALDIEGTAAERTSEIIIRDPGAICTKTYFIEFIKESDVRLKSLTLSVGTLMPEFDPEITEYSCVIPSDALLPVISASPNNPNAEVSILDPKQTNALQREFTGIVTINNPSGQFSEAYSIQFTRTNSEWEWLSPDPPGINFYDAYGLNSNEGMVIGSYGSLLKTSDKGLSWQDINIDAEYALTDIHYVNSDSIIILTKSGTILISKNGGEDFEEIDTEISTWFLDISFINDTTGFICGRNGYVLKTTSFFNDWEVVYHNNGFDLNTIRFPDEENGIAFGNNNLIKTNDGGKTWWRHETGSNINSMAFVNDSVGFAVGSDVLKTTNQGIHWNAIDIGTIGTLNDIRFFSEDEGYIVGDYQILKTMDGGETWSIVKPYNRAWNMGLNSIIRFDDTKLIAFGQYGVMEVSEDNGNTWNPREIYPFFYKLTFASDSVVYATDYDYDGNAGAFYSPVFKSVDGGRSWEALDTLLNARVNDIHFIDAMHGYLIDVYGKLFITADGGESWQTSDLAQNLEAIHMLTANNGFILGDNGSILKTMDGGDSWINVNNSGNTDALFDISFLNFNNGIACGANGTILSTSDGGINWTKVDNGIQSNGLLDIQYFDKNHIFILGSNVFVGSQDGGKTWFDTPVPSNYIEVGIVFLDSLTGYIGDYRNIFKTENGGHTWSNVFYAGLSPIYGLEPNSSGIPHIFGYRGTLRKGILVENKPDGLIRTQPQFTDVIVGDTARFVITTTTEQVSYQWSKNGIEISNNHKYHGTDSSELVIINVRYTDQADYTCRVLTGDSSEVSKKAYLKVSPLVEILSPGGEKNYIRNCPMRLFCKQTKSQPGIFIFP